MAEKFYTLLTNVGKAQIANAISTGTKVVFAKLQLGDGNGSYYEPVESQTTLRKKVWEGAISNVKIHQTNSKWIVVETTIPGNVGGFMIREAGIVDASGRLLVVAKYPETYKPTADDGTIKDLTVRLIIEVANATAVTLKIDPTVILATKKDLDDLSNRKADKVHTHTKSQITDFAHTHDDRYYIKSQVNSLLDNKINIEPISFPIVLQGLVAYSQNFSTTFERAGFKVGKVVSFCFEAKKAGTAWRNGDIIFSIPVGFRPNRTIPVSLCSQ